MLQTQLVRSSLRASAALAQLGFEIVREERIDATETLKAAVLFTLEAEAPRRIQVLFTALSDDDGYFVVVVRDLVTDDDFTLRNWIDWMRKPGEETQPSPFVLRHYSGSSFGDRLAGFMSFLEMVLVEEELRSVLRGDCWREVPWW